MFEFFLSLENSAPSTHFFVTVRGRTDRRFAFSIEDKSVLDDISLLLIQLVKRFSQFRTLAQDRQVSRFHLFKSKKTT